MLTPNVAGRYTMVDFGESRETGGGLALIDSRRQYESLQGRIGVDLGGTLDSRRTDDGQPAAHRHLVHEFNDQPAAVHRGLRGDRLRRRRSRLPPPQCGSQLG